MRNVLDTPVPKVYAWNSKAHMHPVGSEFIIMENIPGVQLRTVWNNMKPVDELGILVALSRYQKSWSSVSFASCGSFYYAKDVDIPSAEGLLYVDGAGRQVKASDFAIGPPAGRDWSDEGTAVLKCDKGPCK